MTTHPWATHTGLRDVLPREPQVLHHCMEDSVWFTTGFGLPYVPSANGTFKGERAPSPSCEKHVLRHRLLALIVTCADPKVEFAPSAARTP